MHAQECTGSWPTDHEKADLEPDGATLALKEAVVTLPAPRRLLAYLAADQSPDP